MNKTGLSKKLKVISACSFILIVIFFVYTLVTNSGIKDVEKSRDTRLILYEVTKLWVMEDIRSYLKVKDQGSFTLARQSAHMNTELKGELYGTQYDSYRFTGASEVNFIDVQYSLEQQGVTSIYLLANVNKGGSTSALNFIVSVKNNTIYDVIAY